ncbi:ATP-binding protein [Nonomuraea lactucae]|uniref:ATP-binding protein n=1 Tax=Nonomuraea lactucae TaxID=2249762 RepID=UPI000DE32AE6|nr:LuxR C-terminal-related transcriptional regulator [Nonomuraea lactucae]
MAVFMAPGPAYNLPAEVTHFVDRRQELAEVRQLLSSSRLVTLTGVGGVGKTRLALQAASDSRSAFETGVWLVELAGLTDPRLLPQAVAAAFGLTGESVQPPLAMLSQQLAQARLLLVLDNCEHLRDACGRLVDTLLRAAPGLRILTTSRSSLGMDEERVYEVQPLEAPESDHPDYSAVNRYGAVMLFADRASTVLPDFTITPENAPLVGRLCRRLDGIPLAVEMAAVRLRTLSVAQILERLDDRFRLLTAGRTTALPRQQTLRALIDWSFGLCSPREQALWARMSVFAGDFDLEAAEVVCAGGGLSRQDIPDLLTGLVHESILIRDDHGSRTRYRLLDTIRAYGRDRLRESGEVTAARTHRDYFLAVAERAESEWFGPRQQAWSDRLRDEHANLRAALEFCCSEPGEAETGLRMAASLRILWFYCGFAGEGRAWLERLLAIDGTPSTARAKALWVDGWLATFRNDVDTGMRRLDECQVLAERFDDRRCLAYVANLRSTNALFQGDPATAATFADEALARHRAVGDPLGVAHALFRVAAVAMVRGDTSRAAALCEECLAMSREREERWLRSYALWASGMVAWLQGDFGRATRLEMDALRLKIAFNDMFGSSMCLETLAWIAAAEGQGERAATLFGALQMLWGQSGLAVYGYTVSYHDRSVAAVRRALGDRAYDTAFRNGTVLTLEQAVAYAGGEELEVAMRRAFDEEASLTKREWEVAELVAQGMSSREIAAELVISPRTAEHHVERILRKLGFTSRSSVAAWMAERHRPEAR